MNALPEFAHGHEPEYALGIVTRGMTGRAGSLNCLCRRRIPVFLIGRQLREAGPYL